MPRLSRIDAPSALYHIIARGIERKRIFTDGVDRDNFLNRLGNILTRTQTTCFSWALIPNHFQRAIGFAPKLLVKSLTITYKLT